MGYLFKGVSPVVASVLLIAFSIAIATLVGTWAMNYTQGKLTAMEAENKCNGVIIQNGSFRYDADARQGIIELQNLGDPISGYRLYAFNDNEQELLKEIPATINKGETKTFSFDTKLAGIKEIMVEVINCPTIKIRVTV
jgi:flagellin-like protein